MTETDTPAFAAATITADDPRYPSLVLGTNHRFPGRPDYVRVVTTTAQVADAVTEAVAAGRRISVRSGGHGFEDLATDGVEVLLDMSEMTEVCYDAERRAFAIEAGATLGHVYRVLFKGWGVTIPAGECPEVGVGGHIVGGGYGPLSRGLGAVVDYLYAVEVVVVGEDGVARAVVATREDDDPHRDLWWAHTGGGGGTFGVVTRYWMRAPGADSDDPARLLPQAPGAWRSGMAVWSWETMTPESFATLQANFGSWFERNSAPDSPYAALAGYFHGTHRSGFGLTVGAHMDDATPDAERLMTSFFEEVMAGVDAKPLFVDQQVRPWLYMSSYPGWGDPGDPFTRRIKIKAAYLRKGYSTTQTETLYRHLTTGETSPVQLILIGYGGRVNAVAPDATAAAQRDSVLKAAYMAVWGAQAEDETNIRRVREMYREVYADTGGVPVPNEANDGSYVNYADTDLADPEWNTSGVPWHTLYFKDNYPRLQRVKKRYDPRDVFRHALSVRLPDGL
ncbi:FAD-binding protein [Streptomyces sp. NPDC048577]|uniref:FAD-dependent oxidoreductase n=1 Tax=Streptomyces sp. NPDC048577 TaxID=3157209 RepID=UPI0034423F18